MKKYLAFTLFAAAILLSMIREWGAPTACSLPGFTRAAALAHNDYGEAGAPARMVVQARPSLRQGN